MVVLTGRADRRSLPVTGSVTVGGDGDVCDLVISAPDIARRHFRLIPVDDGVAVRDLRTRAGTFRNGRRLLGPELLEDGDVLTVGDVDLRFDVDSRPLGRRHRAAAGPGGSNGRPAVAPGAPLDRRSALAEALRTALAAGPDAGSAAGTGAPAPARTVLLCHDPADRDVADLLVAYLQRRGHAVWIDRSPPDATDGWRGRLLDVAWSSDGALFLVSPAGAASERLRREVHVAGAEALPVLPVVVDTAELEDDLAWYLDEHPPVDLRSDPMAGLAALAVAVEALPTRHVARPRRLLLALVVATIVIALAIASVRSVLG